MNKTKKVLSIILITLLILSTVFGSMKKVGLCASSDPNYSTLSSFPLPYNVYQGLDGFSVPTSTCENIINDSLSRMSGYPFGVFTSELASDRSYLNVLVIYMPDNWGGNATSGSVPSSMTPGPNVSIECLRKGYTSYKVFPDGTFQYISTTNSSGSFFWRLNDVCPSNSAIYNRFFTSGWPIYLTSYGQSNTLYFQNQNTGIPVFQYVLPTIDDDTPGFNHYFWDNYQDSIDDIDSNNSIWKPNYQNPSNQQGFWDNATDFFNRSFKSLLGGISGGVKTIGDYICQALDRLEGFLTTLFETFYGWFFDFLDDLLGDIKDDTDDLVTDTHTHYQWQQGFFTESGSSNTSFWDYLDEHLSDTLEDFIDNIWGNLPDIMKVPYRIAQWFYQHGLKNGEFDFLTLWQYLFDFDSQTAYNLWSSNKYGDFVLDVRDFFSNLISSITGVTASDRVFFTISLDDHFGVHIPDIEIDFSWYASIRDQFLPYLMAFLYVSVLWLFFKRLPDILKGVAGAESSFTDSLPYDTHSTTYNGEGIFTSNTHVSNGGRTRVTHNSYKKL